MLSDQKILLAGLLDDERRTIESALIRSGFNTEHIFWGEPLPKEVFACVIVDLGRGEYREASQLLKNPALSQASCITLVDQSNAHARLIAMTMGTDDIIYKPVHLRELIAKVSILIDKYLDRNLGTSTYLEDDIDLLQRLQDYASRGLTGSVSFFGNGYRTEISFEQGLIVGVRNGRKTGSSAITSVWRTLPCQVEYLGDQITRDIDPPLETSKAIAQIADTVQTWHSISNPSPTLNTVCTINWAVYGSYENELPRQVRRIAQLFDGNRSLGEILDAVALDDRLLIKILSKLAVDGILKVYDAAVKDVPLDAWVKQNLKSDDMRSKQASVLFQRQEEVTPMIQLAPLVQVEQPIEVSAASTIVLDQDSEDEYEEEDASEDDDESLYDDETFKDNEYVGEEFVENGPTPSVIMYAGDLEASAAAASANFLHQVADSPEEKLEQAIIEMCRSGELAQLEPDEDRPVDPEELRLHLDMLEEVETCTTVVRGDVYDEEGFEEDGFVPTSVVHELYPNEHSEIVSMGSVPILKPIEQDDKKSSLLESESKKSCANATNHQNACLTDGGVSEDEVKTDARGMRREAGNSRARHDSGAYVDGADDEDEDDGDDFDDRASDLNKARGILDAFSRINPSNDSKRGYVEVHGDKPLSRNRIVESASYTRGNEADTLRSRCNVERGETDVMKRVIDGDDVSEDHGKGSKGFRESPDRSKEAGVKSKRSVPKFPTPEEWEAMKQERIREASIRRQRKITIILVIIIIGLLSFFFWMFLREPTSTTSHVKATEVSNRAVQ